MAKVKTVPVALHESITGYYVFLSNNSLVPIGSHSLANGSEQSHFIIINIVPKLNYIEIAKIAIYYNQFQNNLSLEFYDRQLFF